MSSERPVANIKKDAATRPSTTRVLRGKHRKRGACAEQCQKDADAADKGRAGIVLPCVLGEIDKPEDRGDQHGYADRASRQQGTSKRNNKLRHHRESRYAIDTQMDGGCINVV